MFRLRRLGEAQRRPSSAEGKRAIWSQIPEEGRQGDRHTRRVERAGGRKRARGRNQAIRNRRRTSRTQGCGKKRKRSREEQKSGAVGRSGEGWRSIPSPDH